MTHDKKIDDTELESVAGGLLRPDAFDKPDGDEDKPSSYTPGHGRDEGAGDIGAPRGKR